MNKIISLLFASLALLSTFIYTVSAHSWENHVLAAHNAARARHGACPLTWSDHLYDLALHHARRCKIGPSNSHLYGENLEFLHIPNGGIKEAVAGWMAGGRLYNFRNPGYTTGSSFFTQVVWKATTQVGCAAVTCPPFTIYPGNPATNIVCYYNPRGNVPGQFAQNVGPHV